MDHLKLTPFTKTRTRFRIEGWKSFLEVHTSAQNKVKSARELLTKYSYTEVVTRDHSFNLVMSSSRCAALFHCLESNVTGGVFFYRIVLRHFKQAGRRLSALDVAKPVGSFSHSRIAGLAHHNDF